MIIEMTEGERITFEGIIGDIIKQFMVKQTLQYPIPSEVNIHETILTFSENTAGYWRDAPCSIKINGDWGILNTSFTYEFTHVKVRLINVKNVVSDEKPFSAARFSDWLALTKLIEVM